MLCHICSQDPLALRHAQNKNLSSPKQRCADRGVTPPKYFQKLHDSWSIVSHAAREIVTVFSGNFFYFCLVTVVGEMVKMSRTQ